ncbi:MAG: SDR family NAD(P)-dependent oxidoreductase [Brevinematales bacterium]|nr:SDR family NAD(P)-dependent oxidoreductase [Brevinematales bacterium]
MRVLITGATGFIGHHLVDLLYKEGFKIKCLVRKTSNVAKIKDKVELVYGEVTVPSSLENAVKDVDYVIHSAAVVKALTKDEYYRVNTNGTINLFEAVLNYNPRIKRFVFISSQAASRPSDIPIREEVVSNPVTSYGKSKLEAEKFLENNIDKVPITIIRPSAVYGPGDREFLPVYQMVNKGVEILVKKGKTKLSLVYVKDLVKSIFLAMVSDKTIGKKYFSTYPESVYLADFYREIEKALGKKFVLRIHVPVSVLYGVSFVNTVISRLLRVPSMFNFEKVNEIKESWVCSSENLIRDVNMKYEYSLSQGVEETISWARDNKLL